MPRRTALLTIGVITLGAVLAVIYWSREASCHRMLQTAELAQGSEVRAAIFGGCHVVGPEEVSEPPHRYAVTPKVLAFGKVGYANTRFEPVAGGNYSLEGVRYGGGLEYSISPKTYISAEYQRSEYEGNFGGRDTGLVGVGFRF